MLVVAAPDVRYPTFWAMPASQPVTGLIAPKALNNFAADPMANSPAGTADRFIINIDLSGGGGGSEDILQFNKSIAIDVDDSVPVNDRTSKLVEHGLTQ